MEPFIFIQLSEITSEADDLKEQMELLKTEQLKVGDCYSRIHGSCKMCMYM